MSTHLGRTRFKSLAIGVLAAGLAGVVSAQSTTPPDKDATFRQNVPTAATRNRNGLPGGVVVLHNPGVGADHSGDTRTPIKHVILLIGENRTFDHVFATYTPPAGQSVHNPSCPKASSTPMARPVQTLQQRVSGRHPIPANMRTRPPIPRHIRCCRR
jgi:phospholipase C